MSNASWPQNDFGWQGVPPNASKWTEVRELAARKMAFGAAREGEGGFDFQCGSPEIFLAEQSVGFRLRGLESSLLEEVN